MSTNTEIRKAARQLPVSTGITENQHFRKMKAIFKSEGDDGIRNYIKAFGEAHNQSVLDQKQAAKKRSDDNVRKFAKDFLKEEPDGRA